MNLFHTRPYHSTAASLDLKDSQASLGVRTPEAEPFQDSVSGVKGSGRAIRLVCWRRKFWTSSWKVAGMVQKLPWIRSATLSLSGNWRRGNLWAMGSWSIELSSHNRMQWPFPIAHRLPYWRTLAKDLILFQMQDPAFGLPENQIGECLKYLPRNQDAQRESKVAADQPIFSKQASLNSLTLRRPRPPSTLGRQAWSHFTMLLLFLSELEDHKKFLISFSICKQDLLGMGRTREMWRGMEESTCFTIIRLPAKERHFAFHPSSLALIESKSLLKW